MAATCGRIECAIVVPTGGWTVAVNDGVAYNATIAAGTYAGPTALVTAWISALNTAATGAGSAKNFNATAIANGEQGTGKTTLAISAGTFSLTWTSTSLRDLLGYTGNLSLAGTYTSTSGALGMWLPDCTIMQPFPLGDSGDAMSNITQSRSPAGVTKTVTTSSFTEHPGITWSHVTLARARQSQEASGVRSWERFVRDCLLGSSGLSYFLPGGDHKIWWNADSGTPTPVTYHPRIVKSVKEAMQPAIDSGYVGLWRCMWPGGSV